MSEKEISDDIDRMCDDIDKICDECDGPIKRYGLFDCDDPRHPPPTIAEDCMADIEADMRDRRGFGFASISDDIQWEIRGRWIQFIQKAIDKSR